MRQKWHNEDDVETTPFREMIKLAPGMSTYHYVLSTETPPWQAMLQPSSALSVCI